MARNRTLPLDRGATIGIMGGGQLGRMLAMAAARLGFRTHIYAPAGDNPAFAVAHAHTEAGFDDSGGRFAALLPPTHPALDLNPQAMCNLHK